MPNIGAFRGIRYANGVDPALVTAPPYDVIPPEEADRLRQLHPNNFVHLTLPSGGNDRYERAGGLLREWFNSGVLVDEGADSYYLYRTDFEVDGRRRSVAGLVCELGLERLGDSNIHPHERTMPGPKADRLELLRATRANLEPLWFVTTNEGAGLNDLTQQLSETKALTEVTDLDGVRHRLWRLDPERASGAAEQLRSLPLFIADGHHRYETSLTYREEMGATEGPGPWDQTLALISSPGEYEPVLRPIHRVLKGIGAEDLLGLLEAESFQEKSPASLAREITGRGPGTIGILGESGSWIARSNGTLDTAWLSDVLPPEAEVKYEHDLDRAVAAAKNAAVILLAPIPITLVAEYAMRGETMPAKTTLFWPKPRSGIVLRTWDN